MSLPFLPKLRASGCGDPGYNIPYACLFDGATSYLKRTFAAEGNRRKWTWYGWVKHSALGAFHTLFAAGVQGSSGSGYAIWRYTSTDGFEFHSTPNGSSTEANITFALPQRDPAGYSHVWLEVDTNQADPAMRVRLWINGVAVPGTINTTPVLGLQMQWGRAGLEHDIGRDVARNTYYASLYLVETGYLDGITLGGPVAAGAGYVNRYGVFVPKRPAWLGQGAAAFGAQGSHLAFGDPLNLGADTSGTGNHYTSVGLTAASQVTDTPTHGYPTYTPLAINPTMTLSDGNLTALKTGSYGSAMASILLPTTGKWYWEGKLVSGYDNYIGIARALPGSGAYIGGTADGYAYRSYAGASYKVYGGTLTAYAVPAASGDVVGVCYDADAGTLRFAINGVLYEIAFSGITGRWYPAVSNQWTNAATGWTLNFGQRAFAYAPPAGYKALSTLNLPCPAIKRPERYVTTRLRSAGAAVADLPWSPLEIKTLVLSKRLDGYDWRANDTLRPGRAWAANLTTGDFAEADGLTLTPTGYTVGAAAAYAGSRIDYIWRASAAAGFDILLVDHVTSAPTTVPHGAGRLIDFALVVPVGAGGQRRVYHRGLPAGQYLTLSGSSGTDSGWFASSAIDVTLGASMPSGKYALYVWGAVPGFSSFPTYVGNGGNPGPFSPADFAPAIAFYQGVGKQPFVRDTAQNPTNPVANQLNLCLAGNNATGDGDMDFVSNGIARRNSSQNWNTSGLVHALAMWAGTPGKFARAR